MNHFLILFILIPLAGFLASLLLSAKAEQGLSKLAIGILSLHLLFGFSFMVVWFLSGHPSLEMKELVLFSNQEYTFQVEFYLDKIGATFFMVGSLLTFLVVNYSQYYLHREPGYKRFFNTILFFYLGYNLTILAGNFETLFLGWEILGISSFLLIAFYRDRFLPVKNAIKVFSIYRLGDLGLLLAMWMSHHLWLENISFAKLNNDILVSFHLQSHSWTGFFISVMILLAAAAKSAQLPFSSWLPRAMEGPTPSSAIFYGSLSVHIGVFLLLRTFPFWEHQIAVRIIIAFLGAGTTLVASGISRVQSSIKSQIAYASIAQIGIIFIEIACGWETLALFHFAGNAFLRTYQLLVSPSVVSYLIREQFYTWSPGHKSLESRWPAPIRNTLYMLCLREWDLDSLLYSTIWNPIKRLARTAAFLKEKNVYPIFVPLLLLLGAGLYAPQWVPEMLKPYLPVLLAGIGLSLVLKSFAERKKLRHSWLLIFMSHFWISLAIGYNDTFDLSQIYLYLSGTIVSGLIGYFILRKMARIEPGINLAHFHGHAYEYPGTAFVFLLACLGMTGFPISPAFIGEDLLYTHIHSDQVVLAFLVSLSFVVDGLSIIRIFARVFYGPHIKNYHEIAYRSS
jgi:NADH:ubiquinone oxidoreductase subunit 5 (subunit L)/multisubunit Na+/H+ antiporter MnhA subunit